MSAKGKATPIMLRIHRASASNRRVAVTFTLGSSRRQVANHDAVERGFYVSPSDAYEVLALIHTQAACDNAELNTAAE